MKKYGLALGMCLFSAVLLNTAEAKENRCGWLVNPTPGNWWLTDADGDWMMSVQGGDSLDDNSWGKVPELGGKEYVATNGSYGYGCACLSVNVDKNAMQITKVFSGKNLPLKKCRTDKNLPPEPKD